MQTAILRALQLEFGKRVMARLQQSGIEVSEENRARIEGKSGGSSLAVGYSQADKKYTIEYSASVLPRFDTDEVRLTYHRICQEEQQKIIQENPNLFA